MSNYFIDNRTINNYLDECKAKRAERVASRKARSEFYGQLEAINSRLEACGQAKFELGDIFFTETGWDGSITRHLYTAEEIAKAEKKAVKIESETKENPRTKHGHSQP